MHEVTNHAQASHVHKSRHTSARDFLLRQYRKNAFSCSLESLTSCSVASTNGDVAVGERYQSTQHYLSARGSVRRQVFARDSKRKCGQRSLLVRQPSTPANQHTHLFCHGLSLSAMRQTITLSNNRPRASAREGRRKGGGEPLPRSALKASS